MTQARAWLWVGEKVFPANEEVYRAAALNHFKLMQIHERACGSIEIVRQGAEPIEFWSDFGLESGPARFAYDNI